MAKKSKHPNPENEDLGVWLNTAEMTLSAEQREAIKVLLPDATDTDLDRLAEQKAFYKTGFFVEPSSTDVRKELARLKTTMTKAVLLYSKLSPATRLWLADAAAATGSSQDDLSSLQDISEKLVWAVDAFGPSPRPGAPIGQPYDHLVLAIYVLTDAPGRTCSDRAKIVISVIRAMFKPPNQQPFKKKPRKEDLSDAAKDFAKIILGTRPEDVISGALERMKEIISSYQ